MHRTLDDHLGLTRRSLTTATRDGEEVRVLTAERTYDATADEVWDALTTPDRIARWLGPVSGDLELGGRFQVEGNAGGEVLACTPPERLSITWEYGGEMSWVDVSLRPADVPSGTGTLLQLDHSAPVPPDKWERYGAGAVGIGWELMFVGLGEHLADPTAPRPDSWPDLSGFVAGAGEGWVEASIAAGRDADDARAAGARCLAFYTGAPEPE